MTTVVRHRLRVHGVVQGVGFRPHVYRLANELGLAGRVANDMSGVTIEVEGPEDGLRRFTARLVSELPPLARIDSMDVVELEPADESSFEIDASDPVLHGPVASVPPDSAVCRDCLRELFDPGDRRYRYPFITCTNCGPRFTIIDSLPYDRPNTTMRDFHLCEPCASEYHDPADRRHHAQPLACPDCGPAIEYRSGRVSTTGTDGVVTAVHDDLARGAVVALKGLGGFHLLVDATRDEAVARLRHRKGRADKPFAVMVRDLAAARALAEIGPAEADALESFARPIVLARVRPDTGLVSDLVAPHSPLVGLMLPYTPLHHLLFRPVPDRPTVVPETLVVTSGNVAGEPICHDDATAFDRLGPLADSFCTHDRPIRVPCDDSVVRIIGADQVPIRRSRGQAPLPISLPVDTPPLIAVGGDIKNTFCIARGRTAWLSQHLGDMDNLQSVTALESAIALMQHLYAVEPELTAVDGHPEYRSRRWAIRAGDRPVVEVQHHHAHLAALMAENGLDPGRSVIGFVLDGTGYGSDGTLWGGEILVGDYATVDRWSHLTTVPLPGGEAAVRNPWRTALAHLHQAGVPWYDDLPPLRATQPAERRTVARQLETGLGSPLTSSMGRLFDAVASLLGVRHRISYEAQAAIELEHAARSADHDVPVLHLSVDDERRIDPSALIAELAALLRSGVGRNALALAFHHAVVDLIVDLAERARIETGITTVGLTGGVFQNELVAVSSTRRLESAGFEVLTHRVVPPNDGGIALGQAVVAACRVGGGR